MNVLDVFRVVFGPNTPLWLKVAVLIIAGAALVAWLVKKPDWAGLDTPDRSSKAPREGRAKPPYE